MLLDFREKLRNSKVKYVLIAIICVPFVLVGLGSYFSGGTAAAVAEVNGQSIDQQQWDRAYQQQRQQLARMFGGQLPDAFADETMLRQQALEQLITQQVLESAVAEQKFAVGDKTLSRAIRNLPNFQVDGEFDRDTYQAQLRTTGMSVPMFEQSFRDDAALNQFRTGISDTSFTLTQEADILSALGRQTRTVEAVRFDIEKTKETIEVTDEEVSAFFEENQGNYQFPQRVKIQYVELNSDEVAADIVISDEQAQAYYDDNRARYIVAAQREASHILLSTDDASEEDQTAGILDIKARIEAGEDFAELAEELSTDVGSAKVGGSLGVIRPGAMVPEFEKAVFELEAEGNLSGPVVTQFGVHLIKLDKLTPESGQPFEEVKDQIVTTLQKDEADREFFDLKDLLVESSFDNAGSLEPTADATGLEIKTSEWLDSDTDSGPVLSNPAILNAAFSAEVLDEEINSELIEIDTRHVLVLRVLEHEDERPKALDDVNDEVVDALKSERAGELLATSVSEAVDQLGAGSSAADIVADNELATALSQEVLDRQSTVFDRSAMSRIFSLSHPGDTVITDTATLANGDRLAVRLDVVETPEPGSAEEPVAVGDGETEIVMPPVVAGVLEAGANPRLGGTEFEAMLTSLREKADIDISGAASP